MTAFAIFLKILINFCNSFWRRKAAAVVAGQAWVLAMEAGAREAEAAAAPVGAEEREVPVAVFGKRVSHLRQAEDRFRHLVEAEALEAEKARVLVLEVRVVAVRVAAAPVRVMALAGRERGPAAALGLVGRAVEVARVQAQVGAAVEGQARAQGLAAVVVPVKNRASGSLRLRCCVAEYLAAYLARLALAEAVV